MKRLFLLLAAAAFFAACSSAKEVDEPVEPSTPEAAKRLETLCEQLNGDLATLHTLVAADELPDCVVNVAPIAPAGEIIGYGLAFKQNRAVTLYLDPDAAARKFVPQFGVYEADGIRYWAMNGQPLPTATGTAVPVMNDEDIVPRLKAEKGYWHISVDDGKSWWPAGLAPDGTTELATMPLVSQVTEEAEAWRIVLASGETALSIPKEGTLHIAVDAEELLKFQPGEIHTVHYTVTGGSSKTVVTAELEDSETGIYKFIVTPMADILTGSVSITAHVPATNKVLITATDGARTATTSVDVALRFEPSATSITILTPGTLAELLAPFDAETITELTVRGNLNSTDIRTLKNLPNLTMLDMESVDLEELQSWAFEKKQSLTVVRLPKNLKTIKDYAFMHCENLASVVLPQGLTSIELRAFNYCYNLTNVVLPQSLTSMGQSVFEHCRSLTSIVIPQGVTYINVATFRGCNSLTSVTIPQNVTRIESDAFYKCSSLPNITIPQNVTWIGQDAFWYCSNLTSVTIPANVRHIGGGIFFDCTGLTAIYCKATVPPTVQKENNHGHGYSLFNDEVNATLYVPIGTAEAYKAADGWKEFSNIVEMEF